MGPGMLVGISEWDIGECVRHAELHCGEYERDALLGREKCDIDALLSLLEE